MTPADRAHYNNNGYAVLRGVLPGGLFTALENEFADLQFGILPTAGVADMYSPEFAAWFTEPGEQRWNTMLYEHMRESDALQEFGRHPALTTHIADILGYDSRFGAKAARFRMDQPRDLRYLAVWHQDHAYVGGSTDTVTAWIPLQDVDWPMGPLLVALGSHCAEFGHDPGPNGRKVCYPVEGVDLRALPMRRGDILLFHSLLLHSGQPNLTDRVRYSVQVRYEPL